MRRRCSEWGGGTVLVVVLAVLAVVASPVVAQDGGRRGRGGFERGRGGPMGGVFGDRTGPEYLRRDLPRFITLLELDEAQTMIVEALLLEYEAAFSESAEVVGGAMNAARPNSPEREAERRAVRDEFREMRDEIRALRGATPEGEEIDEEQMAQIRERMAAVRERAMALRPSPEEIQAVRDTMLPMMEQWQAGRDALLRAFVGDTKALLNDEQIELWPRFERTLRREKSLPRGRLSGERVNLFSVVRDLEFDDTTAIDPVLEEYAIAIDDALVTRDKQLAAGREELIDAMVAQDTERAIALMEHDTAARIAVREVNERYAEGLRLAIATNLGELEADHFRQAWRVEAYPRIYRPRSLHRAFAATAGIEDLDDDTATAIVFLEQGYAADLAVRNERLVHVTRDEGPARSQRWMLRRGSFMRGGGGGPGADREAFEDPVGDLYDARSEMEKQYRGRLEALLTPEQVEVLPEPPSEDEGRRFRFGERGERRGGDRDRRRPDRDDRDDRDVNDGVA